MTARKRSCRACGSDFLTTNNSTLCGPCGYQRSRDIGEPCPGCGGPKDRRAKRCMDCRVLPATRKSQPRGPRSTASEVIQRALDEARPVDGGCLLVKSWAPQPKGYVRGPRVDERSPQLIHRLVVEQHLGRRLEPHETVDHMCHNRAVADGTCDGGAGCHHRRCANIEHLDVADAVENWARGRQGTPRERRERTHCPNGHPYEPANLRAGQAGRACKACHRAKASGRDPKAEPTYLT